MGIAEKLAKIGRKNYESAAQEAYISTGYPILDAALSGRYKGGGFRCGRVVEIFGPSAVGKTVIATCAMAGAQKAGGFAGMCDHERTYDMRLAEAVAELSLDPNQWFYDQPATFEVSIDTMKEVVLALRNMEEKPTGEIVPLKGTPELPIDKPIVWLFDSLHSMRPMSTVGKLSTERNMHDNSALSRATSAHLPAIADFAEKTNTLIIFLNQIRKKMDSNPKYPEYTSPGGDSMEFYATHRLQLRRSMIKDKATGDEKGHTVTCKVIKNKVYRPNLKCQWDFVYQEDGTGAFDNVAGIVDRLIDLGEIMQSGAWFTWDGERFQGKKQLVAAINKSPALQAKMMSALPVFLAADSDHAVEHTAPEEAGEEDDLDE